MAYKVSFVSFMEQTLVVFQEYEGTVTPFDFAKKDSTKTL